MNHGTESEDTLENKLIAQLVGLGYESVAVSDEASLLANLQRQLETFNGVSLSAAEFKQVVNALQKPPSVFAKSLLLHDRIQIERDANAAGVRAKKWLSLFDASRPEKNRYQVTHQVVMEGKYVNRYDVTLLINGLPLLHMELKRRGAEIKEAFNQIQRYQKHSFGGLYQYVQLFVISNGVNTKYYANNRKQSAEQTFYWADEQNKTIRRIEEFAKAFLTPTHLGKMIGQYVVRNETDKVLMVLRPYQFYAVEAIVDRVQHPPESNANGYIWHTTGSGKTLTSFKAAQLVKALPQVKKVVFCVDRRDLDVQTIDKFNEFSKGSVDGTNNTAKLVKQFADGTDLIVTTIQKLNTAVSKAHHLKTMEGLRDESVVFIFDECHRSQFGKTHEAITSFFNNHQLFGFTGTPIFAENATSHDGRKQTTKDLFHSKLHSYVITDAISDENVLKFAVDYVGRYQQKDDATYVDIDVEAIDTQELVESPQRLEKIVDYIIANHDAKTQNRRFNAMFCVSSTDMLVQYYELFARKKAEGQHDLRVATIFSYAANEDDPDADGNIGEEEVVGGDVGSPTKREKLDSYIAKYNATYGVGYSTKSTDDFYGYYKDVTKRAKSKQGVEIDILLVVNMFLTGFDAPPMNTLYVDKKLKHHGLIQAYSRTNRILNANKRHGNIVVFRNLKAATDDAIALFSNLKAKEEIFVPPYDEHVAKFNELVPQLLAVVADANAVGDLASEDDQLLFVQLFRQLLRLHKSLASFPEFDADDLLLEPQAFADFISAYSDLKRKVAKDHDKENVSILNDVDFELELVHRDTIGVQYILTLLAQLYGAEEAQQSGIRDALLGAVDDEAELYSKRELIAKFIDEHLLKIENVAEIPQRFAVYWEQERLSAFDQLVKEEQLDADKLTEVVERYVFNGHKPLPDPDIAQLIMKPMKLLERKKTRERVYDRVIEYADTFGGMFASDDLNSTPQYYGA